MHAYCPEKVFIAVHLPTRFLFVSTGTYSELTHVTPL